MDIETVAVTGGEGSVGSTVRSELDGQGFRTVCIDLDTQEAGLEEGHWEVDLLDSGAVHSAMSRIQPDAIAHFGTESTPLGKPGHDTFESNAMSTYNLLEAAAATDVDHVVLPSSLNAMGALFQEAPAEVESLPVDEAHPDTPRDPYALGKRTIELLGEGFARRETSPESVVSLRFPFVATPEAQREHFVEPDRTLAALDIGDERDDLFAYIDSRDAARAVRKALTADLTGHEVFWLSAADTNVETPTERLLAECYPEADTDAFSGHDALVDTSRARDLLDWRPRNSWRDLDGAAPVEDTCSQDQQATESD